MPTLVELERELRQLKEKQDSLDARLKTETLRPTRPDATLTDILNIENGHTVWARTRRMQMTTCQVPDVVAASYGRLRFLDAVNATAIFGVMIPTDWVRGTNLTLNLPFFSTATGTMDISSSITAHSDGETQSLGNIENAVNEAVTTVTANIVDVLTRTITGTAVSAGEMIRWAFTRNGAAGADNLGVNVDAFYGAYLEYTAFM